MFVPLLMLHSPREIAEPGAFRGGCTHTQRPHASVEAKRTSTSSFMCHLLSMLHMALTKILRRFSEVQLTALHLNYPYHISSLASRPSNSWGFWGFGSRVHDLKNLHPKYVKA